MLTALFFARPPATPGPPLRDFEAYYAAGAAWNVGDDPYSRELWRSERLVPGVDAGREELLPFVGPPFALPLWSALARLPWSIACAVWGVVLALAVVALGLGSLALAGPFGAADVLATAGVCAGFGPLTSGAALGQAALVASAAIVAVPFALRVRGAPGIFTTALAAAFAALQPNVALPLLAFANRRRSLIAFALGAAVVAGGSAVALGGPAAAGHYATVLSDHAAAERFIAIQTTTGAVARALGANASLAGGLAAALAVATLAVLVLQFAGRRYGAIERAALASAALPLALPFAHEHDLALGLLPALVCARRASGALWALGACGSLAVGIDWLGLAQRPGGVLQTALLTLACALGLGLLGPPSLGAARWWPLLAAPLVLAAGAAVAAHPLPTWPAALPHGFHPAHELSAAKVWELEQRASGVASLDPRYGLLRLASLAGCALLWACASLALRTQRTVRAPDAARTPEAVRPAPA